MSENNKGSRRRLSSKDSSDKRTSLDASKRKLSIRLEGSRPSTIGKKSVQIVKPRPETPLREQFVILLDGKNVTPKRLNPLSYEKGKERQLSSLDITGARSKSSNEVETYQSNLIFLSEFRQASRGSVTVQSYADADEPMILYDPAAFPVVIDSNVYIMPQQKDEKMPEYVSVVLKETSTEYIFELPSKTADKDTEEGNYTEEDNKRYEYLTVGKGRNRKVLNAEIQTEPILYKTRETEKERVKNVSSYAFASGWDMFDTYTKCEVIKDEEQDKEFVLDLKKSIDSLTLTKEEREFQSIVMNPNFFEACIIIERLLANNNFNDKQKRFRGLLDPEPFRDGIEYKYRLELLWTFANATTKGRCVTAICWNHENNDILAAGYGKFFFATETTGMVLIWNIKNPVQPERVFNFPEPVTCLSFSYKNPNLLAVGFYYGSVKLIDISSRTDVRIIGQSSRETFPTHEAIWQVRWMTDDEYLKGNEQIIALAQDGRIYKFHHTGALNLVYSQMMRISSEGELKGIQLIRKCAVPGLPLTNFPGALVYAKHPTDPNLYYVGATNGVIHKCSKNFFHQHLDSFRAHDGPVKQAKFSPFCNKLLLTCGDDWYARVWLDSVWEPLVELKTNMQTTEGADWSPSHSTIIATIGGNEICIWDLQRKSYAPQSIIKSPTDCRNTIVQFTDDGRCLVVGDIEGNINIFSLEDMPFPAFFQSNLLIQALKRALIIRPDLIRTLKKHGDLNFPPMVETQAPDEESF